MDYDIFLKLIVSLSLGGLIGIERERRKKVKKYGPGIRTFMLISILGFLSSYLSSITNFFWIIPSFLLISFLPIYKLYEKEEGLTTQIASIVTFILGSTVYFSDYLVLPIAITLIIVSLLTFKTPLHSFAYKIKEIEWNDALAFIFITFVILPILPKEPIDPWGLFNPFQIWLFAVLVSTISFISYLIIKFFKKGFWITGFFGGLISSSALTMTVVSKKESKSATPLILIANSTMFIRVLILILITDFILFLKTAPYLLFLSFIGLLYGFFVLKNRKNIDLNIESPFQVKKAIKFAFLFGIILILTEIARSYFGSQGLYVLSFLVGLLDVDAITISISNVASQIGFDISKNALIIVVLSNTITKLIIAEIFGSKNIKRELLFPFSIIFLIGILFIFF